MIIKPKTRGFICTTSHPEGCKANVISQIEYAKTQPKVNGPKKVLVIGSSMGYGLSSRIAAAYISGADTIGIIFDKNGDEKRTGTSGWYNTAAFEQAAEKDGLYAKTINGDAFSTEIKEKTIDLIKKDFGTVDMIIYSLAAPRRTTSDGTTYSSVLKTTEGEYTNKTIDLKTNEINEVTIPSANEQEISDTIKVMGGEDWLDWINAMDKAGVLAKGCITLAYSYIGPEITHPMYLNGSIGKAKEHLFNTSKEINEKFHDIKAYISVNKALVTQSSTAIPIVPLYITILFSVMKKMNNHEGCIEQMCRLFTQKMFCDGVETDESGRIRLDDLELLPEVQEKVNAIWSKIDNENLKESADLNGFWDEFFKLFGFGFDNVDYDKDISADVKIPSID